MIHARQLRNSKADKSPAFVSSARAHKLSASQMLRQLYIADRLEIEL